MFHKYIVIYKLSTFFWKLDFEDFFGTRPTENKSSVLLILSTELHHLIISHVCDLNWICSYLNGSCVGFCVGGYFSQPFTWLDEQMFSSNKQWQMVNCPQWTNIQDESSAAALDFLRLHFWGMIQIWIFFFFHQVDDHDKALTTDLLWMSGSWCCNCTRPLNSSCIGSVCLFWGEEGWEVFGWPLPGRRFKNFWVNRLHFLFSFQTQSEWDNRGMYSTLCLISYL